MDIVTLAGTGRHVGSWRSHVIVTPSVGVAACGPQGQQVEMPRPRIRRRDLRNLPTFRPQRPSAPSRWGT